MGTAAKNKTKRAPSGPQQARRKNRGWFTSETGRKARKLVSSDSCARNGRLGAIATITKHGVRPWFKKWRKWKLENPSGPELQMIGILATLKVRYKREWQLGDSRFSIDFYVPSVNRGIEVHGDIHKRLDAEKRAANDVKKSALAAELGVEILWVQEADFNSFNKLIAKVRDFIFTSPRAKKGGY